MISHRASDSGIPDRQRHLPRVRGARLALAAWAAVVLALGTAAPASAAFGILYSFGSFGSGDGQLNTPTGAAVDATGNIFVAEFGNNRIQTFSPGGGFLRKWGSEGIGDGQFIQPRGIEAAGGQVYVSDSSNGLRGLTAKLIQVFNAAGDFRFKFGTAGGQRGELNGPRGMTTDAAGNLYVADSGNNKIVKFTSQGGFLDEFGTFGSADGQFRSPTDVAVDGAGNIYVADLGNDRIQKFNSSFGFVAKWGSEGEGDGQFDGPEGIATDAAGTVYVADQFNDRIQVFSSAGAFLGKFGQFELGECEGHFSGPSDVETDAAGRVYVTDTGNDRIQVFGQGGAPIPRCPGTTPPGGTPPGGTPPGDDTPQGAPAMSGVSLTRSAFCVGRRCPRSRRGTAVRFGLSGPASVRFRVDRRLAGRRVGGRCRRATRRNRDGRRCSLYAKVGSFSRPGTAGANRIPFSGKIGTRALRPGSYRLSVTAIGANGARSAVKRIRFRVYPPNRARGL